MTPRSCGPRSTGYAATIVSPRVSTTRCVGRARGVGSSVSKARSDRSGFSASKVLRIQQHQSGNRFAPQGPADGRVVYQAVSDAAGTGRTDDDLALWTDEVEEIELEAPLDQLEALLEILQSFQLVAAGDIHNGSLERGHMNDGLQFAHPAAEERPCAPDVELHLLLGLGEDAVLEQAPSEQAEKPADQQNKQRKDLQEFRFQHANIPHASFSCACAVA